MHSEAQLTCVFGCRDSRDDTAHYLECKRFWRLLLPQSLVQEPTAAQKLLFVDPSKEMALYIVTLFLSYNNCKYFQGSDRERFNLIRLHRVVKAAQDHALTTCRD